MSSDFNPPICLLHDGPSPAMPFFATHVPNSRKGLDYTSPAVFMITFIYNIPYLQTLAAFACRLVHIGIDV